MEASKLNYYKEILEDRKKQIFKNIHNVSDELAQLSECELNDEGDHVATITHSVVDNILARRQVQELKEINRALNKIASKKYGTCEMCGVDIGSQRLGVKPHALYCIDCREIAEKTEDI
ncbi:MAG: C4-type zinc finger protein, DksA/TraR family [uncultured Sulfurovum sp.]|uniref:C4-type zinc finger protein, DksA/TraR family n=1 Tax=uncultured Sulfurovum sp. TaxID=269237 RepID=A0A6S6SHG0_9BACT|nr:MAG: C4-type zinc finger protein, DksA/TraR family [uncultured Sulfurovum sp.]